MAKAYVILYDSNQVIFPVKAKFNPYVSEEELAYCSGLPQFFGGGYAGEDLIAGLKREVDEEAILTYALNGGLSGVYDGSYYNRAKKKIRCLFHCADKWTKTDYDWPNEKGWGSLAPKYREMCWVAAAPKSAFSSADPKNASSLIAALIAAGQKDAPEWAQGQMSDVPSEDFTNSLTCAAFVLFLQIWLSR